MRSWSVFRAAGLSLILILLLYTEASGQESPGNQGINSVQLKVTGGIQSRFSYGLEKQPEGDVERAGFGIRRGRIDATVTTGGGFGINYDADFARGTLNTVDIFGFYEPSNKLRIRFGLFAPAQPRAYILTSFVRLDGIERAAIADRWARSTAGASGRDFGIDATFNWNATILMLGLLNGDNSFASGDYWELVSGLSSNSERSLTTLAYGAYINHQLMAIPGLEIGGYVSYNGSRNPNTRAVPDGPGRYFTSWSGHAYWGSAPGSQPVRLKLDMIGLNFEDVAGPVLTERRNTLAFAVTGAVRLTPFSEFYGRYEQQNVDDGPLNQFVSTGISYSLSARNGMSYEKQRITLGYQGGYSDFATATEQYVVVLQLQLVF